MLEFLLADENIPYAVVLTLLLFLCFFEGVGTLLGLGISGVLDSLIPDIPDIDTSHNLNVHELGSGSSITRLLGWLRVGKVPLLILLIIYLFWFGSIGYFLNYVSMSLMNILLPKIISIPIAVFGSLPATRIGGAILEKIMPKDETSSVSIDSFLGREAKITIGQATDTITAEAKIVDEYGQTHYIMVLAEEGQGPYSSENLLLIVRRIKNCFIVIQKDKSQ